MTPRPTEAAGRSRLALVTGATGYVGGQVILALAEQGWRVRALVRSAAKAASSPWAHLIATEEAPGRVQLCEGDAGVAEDLRAALDGVDVAWYLLHSMSEDDDFVAAEVAMAEGFAEAAEAAAISRIIYLGGLHPTDLAPDELSDHLRSRVEVGEVFLNSTIPAACLQAGVVIGAESSSFIMLRHLSERLPGAVGPTWLRNRICPIGIEDAVHYLVAAADLDPEVNRAFDIGGPEDFEYAGMMQEYAKAIGLLPRFIGTAPVTTPRLAARWIGLVTPISSRLARPLIGSLAHDTVLTERDLDSLVGPPPGGHTTFREAVLRATRGVDTRRWVRTAASVGAAVGGAAIVGSLSTSASSSWYRRLTLPRFAPPPPAFGIVWPALYGAIGCVASLSLADLAEREEEEERRAYRRALGINLALNATWSASFFRLRRLKLATAHAAALAVSSADLVRRSAKVSPEKGVVLAPYAAWTAFACVLSGTIARDNA